MMVSGEIHEVPVSVEVGVYPSAADLPESAKALLRREGEKDLFSSEEWFDLLLRNAWEGSKPLLYAARDTLSVRYDHRVAARRANPAGARVALRGCAPVRALHDPSLDLYSFSR